MHKGYFRQAKVEDEIKEDIPIASRRKGRKRPVLTTSEKIDIVHQAIVEKLPFKEIAKEHRVSIGTVSQLV